MTQQHSRRLTRIAAVGAVAALAAAGGASIEAHAALSSANSSRAVTPTTPYQGSKMGGGHGSGSAGWGYGSGGYGGWSYGSADGSDGGPGSSTTPIQPATEATAAQTVGVVDVLTTLDYGQDEAAGTGIVLTSTGRILTNNHVIDGATSVTVVDLTTGRHYSASVVGDSPTNDVAVLQLQDASGLQVAPLGDSNTVVVGQSVTGVGNAGNAPGTSAAAGTVTALGQAITASEVGNADAEQVSGLIQTSADIQPGDSGGPLLDSSGRVVGMDTAAATSPRTGAIEAGYAIPIDHALDIAHQVVSGVSNAMIQQGLPAFLGVQLLPDGVTGAESATTIEGVIPDTAAARLGLTAGDTLTEVGGNAVSTQSDVDAALSTHRPGEQISIGWVDAAGSAQQGTATLGAGPAN
jgi:S1-C subfamily serine protease